MNNARRYEIFIEGFSQVSKTEGIDCGFSLIPMMKGIDKIITPIPEKYINNYIPTNKLGENK